MTAASPVAQPDAVTVRFSSGGLAFASRGQPRALLDAEATVSTRDQRVRVVGQTPHPWTFEAADSDELRAAVAPLRWRLRWSPEDVGAFAALAMWTYVNMPFLLANGGIESTRRGIASACASRPSW